MYLNFSTKRFENHKSHDLLYEMIAIVYLKLLQSPLFENAVYL